MLAQRLRAVPARDGSRLRRKPVRHRQVRPRVRQLQRRRQHDAWLRDPNTDSDPQHCGSCSKAMRDAARCARAANASRDAARAGITPAQPALLQRSVRGHAGRPEPLRRSCTKVCTTPPHASVTCEMSKVRDPATARRASAAATASSPTAARRTSRTTRSTAAWLRKSVRPQRDVHGRPLRRRLRHGSDLPAGVHLLRRDELRRTRRTTSSNCGMCDNKCPPIAHGTPACAGSMCKIGSCDMGFADCNNSAADGCETNTNNDPQNCGACNHPCGASGVCVMGMCINSCNNGPPCTSRQNLLLDRLHQHTRTDLDNAACAKTSLPDGRHLPELHVQAGQQLQRRAAYRRAGGCSDTSGASGDQRDEQGRLHGPGQIGYPEQHVRDAVQRRGPACTSNQTCCMTGCADTDTTNDPNSCGMCGLRLRSDRSRA